MVMMGYISNNHQLCYSISTEFYK